MLALPYGVIKQKMWVLITQWHGWKLWDLNVFTDLIKEFLSKQQKSKVWSAAWRTRRITFFHENRNKFCWFCITWETLLNQAVERSVQVHGLADLFGPVHSEQRTRMWTRQLLWFVSFCFISCAMIAQAQHLMPLRDEMHIQSVLAALWSCWRHCMHSQRMYFWRFC